MSTTLHPPALDYGGPRWRLEQLTDRQVSRAGRLTVGRACRDVQTYVTFIGYPRSGHSMVGSLLDAHPQAAISHELDALRYVGAGYDRWRLFHLILTNVRRTARRGRVQTGYSYAVPGQWQGRWENLAVIGDKKGGRSTIRLDDDPALIQRLHAVVRLPTRYVLIVRNPFDNVATIAKRDVQEQGIEAETALEHAVRRYVDLTARVDRFVGRVAPSDVHIARHEDFIERPQDELRRLCAFVGLTPERGYLDACAGLLFASPNRSRDTAGWTTRQRDEVEALIARHEFLAGYTFSD
ncbi:sulfotransferase [Svornostia abyssi]|uniref:Sulfotransferase n=1 Tax=Svornostia abyssi TaxID=2898438 RepID=A0ABY5PAH8_9ACTN|nr:sulfotransferase [Parviterribacteraceae bacterium J379]